MTKPLIAKDEVRAIFIQNGFTIKEGQNDLKDYVYTAAGDLIILTSIRLQAGLREMLVNALNKGGEDLRKSDAIEAFEVLLEVFENGINSLQQVQTEIASNREKL